MRRQMVTTVYNNSTYAIHGIASFTSILFVQITELSGSIELCECVAR